MRTMDSGFHRTGGPAAHVARAFLTVAILVPALAAAIVPVEAAKARVKIVASLPNFGSIAREVGGDRVEVTTIALGVQDAHFVDPKPSYIVRLRAADLLLVNGLDLEIGWIPPLVQGARTARLMPGGASHVDCSQGIQVLEVPAVLSRSEGDIHPFGNPHYLADPLNAESVAATIAEALKRIDPEGAKGYEERRRDFTARLHNALFGPDLVGLAGGPKLAREAASGNFDALLDGTRIGGQPLRARLGGWLGAMAPYRGRPIVTYHRDYSYFAARFGLHIVAYLEPKPGIPPAPKHLEEISALLQGGAARVIVTRPFVEHRSTDLIAARTGATILTLPLEAGGAEGTDSYLALIDHVVAALAGALRDTGGGAPGG
jgi:ABC-type Zn uptake system ZnuABC Zn-binding protein ZnuA